jgi:hypothetical protein
MTYALNLENNSKKHLVDVVPIFKFSANRMLLLGIAIFGILRVANCLIFPETYVRTKTARPSSDCSGNFLFLQQESPMKPLASESFSKEIGKGRQVGAIISTRRSLVTTIATFGLFVQPTYAIFGQTNTRIQLELCLVTILRVKYWADRLLKSLQLAFAQNNTIRKKELYLECRMGAKALLTGRVGGGGNSMVYNLATFRLRECLKDGIFWYHKQQPAAGTNKQQRRLLEEASEEIIYALGALVEFDGFDNTADESPRSSLTITMYNDDKGIFVSRMIREKLLPACDVFLYQFNGAVFQNSLTASKEFIKYNYPSEIPPSTEAIEAKLDSTT